MKVIVTGGRDYSNKDIVYEVLDSLCPDIIIHGDCSGADSLAKQWAIENNKEQISYPYPSKHGRAGGPIRNKQMCEEHPEATLIAFPGGKGTANCILNAEKLNMQILIIEENIETDPIDDDIFFDYDVNGE